MKIAIIYYSLEGSTRLVADTLASELGGDVIELHPVKEIPKSGFMKYFWGGKQVMMKELVELEPYTLDESEYDLIIVGTPVWAYTFSPPVRSFFEKHTLAGKNVAFYACHEGGLRNTLEDMKNACSKSNPISTIDFSRVVKRREEVKNEAIAWARTLTEL